MINDITERRIVDFIREIVKEAIERHKELPTEKDVICSFVGYLNPDNPEPYDRLVAELLGVIKDLVPDSADHVVEDILHWVQRRLELKYPNGIPEEVMEPVCEMAALFIYRQTGIL